MENIVIKRTNKSDIEQIIKLANAVWRVAYAHIMPQEIFDFNDANIGEKIDRANKWQLNTNGNINLVAVANNKIVAFASGDFGGSDNQSYVPELTGSDRIRNFIENKKLFWAEIVCVLPEYRNQGLQKILLKELIGKVKAKDIEYVVGTVSPDNIVSLNNLLNCDFHILDMVAYKINSKIYKRYLIYFPTKTN